MYCRQCEQTGQGVACSQKKGVCGKTEEVAVLQDLLIHGLKGIAVYGKAAREAGIKDAGIDRFIIEGLFLTVTNVNFDPQKFCNRIKEAYGIRESLKERLFSKWEKAGSGDFKVVWPSLVKWQPAQSYEQLLAQGQEISLQKGIAENKNIASLQEILLYGLKGMAAYADHALILDKEDESVNSFFYKGLAALADTRLGSEDLLSLMMEFGQVNLRCMEILDQAHTERFGDPEPTKVSLGVKQGPAIIVSGHDLLDLYELLEQTKNKGINIYTHGEMLPAHGYPELKKYKHLAGHFGTAWQNQQKEFDGIPGAILMTTNCLQEAKPSYQDRIFTTGLVDWQGICDVQNRIQGQKDFSPVIEKALALGGFKEDKIEKEITVGFGHKTIAGVADKVLDLVKQKKIRHFFLIGGCDGARPGRNYYTEFAENVPRDCVILTLACGKFRINRLDYGEIAGIPRLLDCGQCNDAYSAIKVAGLLADKIGCGVNDLPLSLILSWYEQKAVCILLTLLALGIKNIRLGPSLPAFITPEVLGILVKKFNIKAITDPKKDLNEILGINTVKV